MCLVIKASFESDGLPQGWLRWDDRRSRLVALCRNFESAAVRLGVAPASQEASPSLIAVWITAPKAGCACGLLTDEAGWDEPTWAMHQSACESLAGAIECLANVADFRFTAMWAGDTARERISVEASALALLAKRSQIRTKAEYRVAGRPS